MSGNIRTGADHRETGEGVRRLRVRREPNASADAYGLEVDCPMVRDPVLLERCVDCEYGKGLLLDPDLGALTLRCGYAGATIDGAG